MPVPAVFLDRDGVIIENCDEYVRRWEDVSFIPGSLQALRDLAEAHIPVVIVTNQGCIGKEIISLENAWEIQKRIETEIRLAGGSISKSYLCPHTNEDNCRCRKPMPGMLLEAASELDIDLSKSMMIGDALTDISAGETAGCRSSLVLTGRGRAQFEKAASPPKAFENLHQACASFLTELAGMKRI